MSTPTTEIAAINDDGMSLSKSSIHRRRNRLVPLMLTLAAYSATATMYLAHVFLLPVTSSVANATGLHLSDPRNKRDTEKKTRLKRQRTDKQRLLNDFKANLDWQLRPVNMKKGREDAAHEYVCDSQGVDAYLPETDLVRRSLHAIIIGTMKGGTQALHTNLLTHPKILSSGKGHGELHFFNRLYKRDQSRGVVHRRHIREAFLEVLKDRGNYFSKREKIDISNERNEHKVGIHSAPIYLFSGRNIVSRMLCAAPWVKAIAVLRNPVERAYSQYHFTYSALRRKDADKPTFREFILRDVELLKDAGVLRDWNTTDFDTFAGSREEFAAWETYLKYAKSNGPVGRGLYAIQLEILMDEFTKYNKTREDLLVLQSESSKEYPQEAYHQTVQFLGLEKRTLRKHAHVLSKNHHATRYSDDDGISEEMHKMLFELFEPYNRRLYDLLGREEWGGTWDA